MDKVKLRKQYLSEFYKKNKLNFSMAMIVTLLLASFNLLISYIMQVIIDTAVTGTENDIIRLGIMVIITVVAFVIIYALDAYISPKYIYKALKQYKVFALEKIFKKNIASYKKEGASVYISALTNDLQSIENNYIANIFQLVMQIFLFVGALGLMLYYNRLLTVVSIALSIIPLIVILIFGKRLAVCEEDVSKQNEVFMHSTQDTLSGFSVVKTFKAERPLLKLLFSKNNDLEISRMKRRRTTTYIDLLATAASFIAQFGVFLYGAYLAVTTQSVTPGIFVVFVQLMNFIVNPINQVPKMIAQRKSVIPLIDKLAAASSEEEKEDKTLSLDEINKGITLKNMSFAYDDVDVLKDVDFTFDHKKSYAIIGASGSGKTTLFNLLMGNYDNYKGSIKYDDVELNQLKNESIYSLISLVEQNVFVFDSTIRDNITMYNDFDDAKINDAIKLSGLSHLIEEKGQLYLCGEGGKNLSGGEKQRISIARGLIKDSNIFLMDEATSSLDNETSIKVTEAVLDIPNMIKIIITHRLEEVILRKYDQILVINHGKIHEHGTFDELMEKNDILASMFKIANG